MKSRVHWIYGSGLIGSYLGGVLSQRHEVAFVGRPLWNERLINGFTLADYTGAKASFRATPAQIHTHLPEQLENAVIWLTVKCTALNEVLAELQSKLGNGCTLICCQNGIGSVESVKAHLPHCNVIQGIVGFNVVWNSECSELRRSTEGVLALQTGSTDNLQPGWLSCDHTTLLPIFWPQDMEAYCWAKLQLNLANAVNALADVPIRDMLQNRHYRSIIAALMDELLLVAKTQQLKLPQLTKVPAHWIPRLLRLPNWLFRRIASKMLDIDPTARSSMWWDLQAGKTTEVQYLNGAVAQIGKQLGVPCPANDTITQWVQDTTVKCPKAGNSTQISPKQLKTAILG